MSQNNPENIISLMHHFFEGTRELDTKTSEDISALISCLMTIATNQVEFSSKAQLLAEIRHSFLVATQMALDEILDEANHYANLQKDQQEKEVKADSEEAALLAKFGIKL